MGIVSVRVVPRRFADAVADCREEAFEGVSGCMGNGMVEEFVYGDVECVPVVGEGGAGEEAVEGGGCVV